MHKPTPKGRLERWFDRVSNYFDRWFNKMEKKHASYAQHSDEESFVWEINEILGFSSDPKNLKRFIK